MKFFCAKQYVADVQYHYNFVIHSMAYTDTLFLILIFWFYNSLCSDCVCLLVNKSFIYLLTYVRTRL